MFRTSPVTEYNKVFIDVILVGIKFMHCPVKFYAFVPQVDIGDADSVCFKPGYRDFSEVPERKLNECMPVL